MAKKINKQQNKKLKKNKVMERYLEITKNTPKKGGGKVKNPKKKCPKQN